MFICRQEINIKVGNKSPVEYFGQLFENFVNSETKFSGIATKEELLTNLKMHSIPEMILSSDALNYEDFLNERRNLMALKIKEYYFSL